MIWRALGLGVMLTMFLVAALLYVASSPAPPLRHFVITQQPDGYRIQAHEVVAEGFCSVFIRDGVRIAAVCGSHTWSETSGVE